jgi:hypothetical protein
MGSFGGKTTVEKSCETVPLKKMCQEKEQR